MKGLTFLNDPWKLRTDQVFTLILMWKQDPWMRRCMDVHIVKKIAEYIKIDLSGLKLLDGGRICFVHVIFRTEPSANYYGWKIFPNYYSACIKCLRPLKCSRHYKNSRVGNDISSYRNRFEFDDPILEA